MAHAVDHDPRVTLVTLDADPLDPAALSRRRDHIVSFYRMALLP